MAARRAHAALWSWELVSEGDGGEGWKGGLTVLWRESRSARIWAICSDSFEDMVRTKTPSPFKESCLFRCIAVFAEGELKLVPIAPEARPEFRGPTMTNPIPES